MKHIDLFSGIGGFALAVDTVWPESEHIFCDHDEFCQQVLNKHWPKSKIYGDIRTLKTLADTGGSEYLRIGREEIQKAWRSCDLVTGGFPCQPFSNAGQRRGTEDNRYLWPEMFRVISTFKPTWVVAENVRGLITWSDGLVFKQVCSDLESQGYGVQAFVVPALAINAPHRRDRVWFVAHANGHERGGRQGQVRKEESLPGLNWQAIRSGEYGRANKEWDREWQDVAAELCRVDDGLPVELDGFKLTKAGHRAQRLKALGNSIVPQVAIEIMKAIKLSQTL